MVEFFHTVSWEPILICPRSFLFINKWNCLWCTEQFLWNQDKMFIFKSNTHFAHCPSYLLLFKGTWQSCVRYPTGRLIITGMAIANKVNLLHIMLLLLSVLKRTGNSFFTSFLKTTEFINKIRACRPILHKKFFSKVLSTIDNAQFYMLPTKLLQTPCYIYRPYSFQREFGKEDSCFLEVLSKKVKQCYLL